MVHKVQQTRIILKWQGSTSCVSTCLYGPCTDQDWLGPLVRRISAVSARDIILVKRRRVSTQATNAPTPDAAYIQPSVNACSINRWICAWFLRDGRLVTRLHGISKSGIKMAHSLTQRGWQSSVSPSRTQLCAIARTMGSMLGHVRLARPRLSMVSDDNRPLSRGSSPRTRSIGRLLRRGI